MCEYLQKTHTYICAFPFCIIPPHSVGTGSWNPFIFETRTYLLYKNIATALDCLCMIYFPQWKLWYIFILIFADGLSWGPPDNNSVLYLLMAKGQDFAIYLLNQWGPGAMHKAGQMENLRYISRIIHKVLHLSCFAVFGYRFYPYPSWLLWHHGGQSYGCPSVNVASMMITD